MPQYSHGVIMDISDRKRAEEQGSVSAYHDDLTGLPSRAMFEELLDLSVARARRHDGSVAVLSVDLNEFRLVNDSLGHQAGDALLVAVADRLRDATRETDLVARRGGDQFLSAARRPRSRRRRDRQRGDARPGRGTADPVLAGSAVPVAGTEVYVAASIGISMFPSDADRRRLAAPERGDGDVRGEAQRSARTSCSPRRARSIRPRSSRS
jgi:diguanylate cyclase (GGDEF)-like protein